MAALTRSGRRLQIAQIPPPRFLSLPNEVRIQIYRLLFRLWRNGSSLRVNDVIWAAECEKQDMPVAFLVTCRQIYHEASAVLYGENEFSTIILPQCGARSHGPRFPLLRFDSITQFTIHVIYHSDGQKRIDTGLFNFLTKMTSLQNLTITISEEPLQCPVFDGWEAGTSLWRQHPSFSVVIALLLLSIPATVRVQWGSLQSLQRRMHPNQPLESGLREGHRHVDMDLLEEVVRTKLNRAAKQTQA